MQQLSDKWIEKIAKEEGLNVIHTPLPSNQSFKKSLTKTKPSGKIPPTDQLIESIIDCVVDNLDYESRCFHSDNCDVYGYVYDKPKVINFIKDILEQKEV